MNYSSIIKILFRSFVRAGIAVLSVFVIGLLCFLYSRFIEPKWVAVRTISISDNPTLTLIHISDIHYKGDKSYLKKVVKIINKTEADFVCFTGDLIEEKVFLADCLDILCSINKPLYGIYGNHDEWAHVSISDVAEPFASTGGRWLERGDRAVFSNKVVIVGEASDSDAHTTQKTAAAMKRILLNHYPGSVNLLSENSYDLILAGHTHGGQVNLPFVGIPFLAESDKVYLRGLFHTKAGALYVNPGIGTYYWPIRFRCRPEITVIKF